MRLFQETMDSEVDELDAKGIQLRIIGDRAKLSPRLRGQGGRVRGADRPQPGQRPQRRHQLRGRSELVEAIRELAASGVDLRHLDEATLSAALYTAGLPDPDLIIRTAGRAPGQQLPALAGGLRRAARDRHPLAGLRPRRRRRRAAATSARGGAPSGRWWTRPGPGTEHPAGRDDRDPTAAGARPRLGRPCGRCWRHPGATPRRRSWPGPLRCWRPAHPPHPAAPDRVATDRAPPEPPPPGPPRDRPRRSEPAPRPARPCLAAG